MPNDSFSMEEKIKKRITDSAEALRRAEAWCAYQERCQQETRDKLYAWGLYPYLVENVIVELITSGFINEERFAEAYAGGKFRIKKWGRVKIKIELKKKKVSDYCIRKGLAVIDERDYHTTLKKLFELKSKLITEKHPLKRKYKVMQYLISRGYEPDLVRELFKEED